MTRLSTGLLAEPFNALPRSTLQGMTVYPDAPSASVRRWLHRAGAKFGKDPTKVDCIVGNDPNADTEVCRTAILRQIPYFQPLTIASALALGESIHGLIQKDQVTAKVARGLHLLMNPASFDEAAGAAYASRFALRGATITTDVLPSFLPVGLVVSRDEPDLLATWSELATGQGIVTADNLALAMASATAPMTMASLVAVRRKGDTAVTAILGPSNDDPFRVQF